MKILSHYAIFSGPADDFGVSEAKKYIKRFGLSSDDVAIRKNKDTVSVITKREIELNGKS